MGTRRIKAPKKLKPGPTKLDAPVPSRLMTEKTMHDIHKLLEARKFQDIEEVNRFLQTLTGPGLERALQDIEPPTPQQEAQDLA